MVHSDPPGSLVWADRVREVENLGYDTLLMTDHIDGQYAMGPAMGAAAMVSSRLHCGSLVYCNDFYNPVLLAREAASLDHISGGRFLLGIGAGWDARDYARTGVAFDSAGVRIDRLAESIEIIRACFTGEPFSFAGKHYKVDADTSPVAYPVTPGGPPILVGGGGRRVLRLAGAAADLVSINPSLTTADWSASMFGPANDGAGTAEKLTWIAEGAGARLDEIELSATSYVTINTADRDRAARYLARRAQADVEHVLTTPHALLGTTEQIVATLEERRERWGLSYIMVDELHRHALAPVVEKLAGT